MYYFFQWAFHFWKIDLSRYREISDYLKGCCKGESVKKAKTFDWEDLNQFLESPIVKTSVGSNPKITNFELLRTLEVELRTLLNPGSPTKTEL